MVTKKSGTKKGQERKGRHVENSRKETLKNLSSSKKVAER